MFQRFQIPTAQVKVGNTDVHEIRQTIYSWYREKEDTKKVNINIVDWIKL